MVVLAQVQVHLVKSLCSKAPSVRGRYPKKTQHLQGSYRGISNCDICEILTLLVVVKSNGGFVWINEICATWPIYTPVCIPVQAFF